MRCPSTPAELRYCALSRCVLPKLSSPGISGVYGRLNAPEATINALARNCWPSAEFTRKQFLRDVLWLYVHVRAHIKRQALPPPE